MLPKYETDAWRTAATTAIPTTFIVHNKKIFVHCSGMPDTTNSSFGLLVKLLGLARNLLDLCGAFRRYSEIAEDWKKSVLGYIISLADNGPKLTTRRAGGIWNGWIWLVYVCCCDSREWTRNHKRWLGCYSCSGCDTQRKIAEVRYPSQAGSADLTSARLSINNADLRESNHVCGNKDGGKAVSGITGGYP